MVRKLREASEGRGRRRRIPEIEAQHSLLTLQERTVCPVSTVFSDTKKIRTSCVTIDLLLVDRDLSARSKKK